MRTYIYITRDNKFKIIDAENPRKAENAFRKAGFSGARHGNVTDITDAIREHITKIKWETSSDTRVRKSHKSANYPIEVSWSDPITTREQLEALHKQRIKDAEALGLNTEQVQALNSCEEALFDQREDRKTSMRDPAPPVVGINVDLPPVLSTARPGWNPEQREKLIADFEARQRDRKIQRLIVASGIAIAMCFALIWAVGTIIEGVTPK